jgi:hypothetical protein
MKREKLLMGCKTCLGDWGCNKCGKRIVSHSKVVRNVKVDGQEMNLFFCTRTCFKIFVERYKE